MVLPPIKIVTLLQHAVSRLQARPQLFWMLALLAGLMSSILMGPAYELTQQIVETLAATDQTGADRALVLINENWTTLAWAQVAVTFVNAMLLVPWARAAAPGGLAPASGGSGAMLRRILRAFWHQTFANILFVLLVVFGGVILGTLAASVGFLSMVIVFAGTFAIAWISIALFAMAHFAMLLESLDKPSSLADAFQSLKLQARPATASLGVLFLVYLIVNTLLSSLIGSIDLGTNRLWLIVSGALTYAISALHIAALSRLIIAKPVDLKA